MTSYDIIKDSLIVLWLSNFWIEDNKEHVTSVSKNEKLSS